MDNNNLNITPPDNLVFEKKTSSKQKDHLEKARVKAKETIIRRRRLDEENSKIEEKDDDKLETSEDKEKEEEKEESVKPKREFKINKKIESPEDKELRKFESFMKNMNLYEDVKAKHQEQIEEAKKIKCSFTQDEYKYIMDRLEEDDKRNEENLNKVNPSLPSKKEIPIRRTMNTRTKVSRFGR
ncbi:MAG: hypothetical protein H8E55_59320 [Pelagibacterales bacterium]|nr:hypothetical protein [Pelagibacterales bacterium]